MAAHTFQDLLVWQKAMDLVEQVYKHAGQLPDYERYALADQMRRSAVSVASNIAEGQQRFTAADTAHFISMAIGSTGELQTQLLLANRLYSLNVEDSLLLATEVSKMLFALNKRLRPNA